MNGLDAIGSLGWAALGVAATLVSAYVARRMGWLEITIMREAHALNVSKATPRIGCDCRILKKQILGSGYNPHLVIVVELYNEGDLAVHDVEGEWTAVGPGNMRTSCHIQRDFLGKCDSFRSEYQITESPNWPKAVTFDIVVDFYYLTPGQPDEREHFEATYHHDGATGAARRTASTKPRVH
jgi:hypothetical protein